MVPFLQQGHEVYELFSKKERGSPCLALASSCGVMPCVI